MRHLENLRNSSVHVAPSGAYPEVGAASVRLLFSEGSTPRADYWRLSKVHGKTFLLHRLNLSSDSAED